MRLDSSSFRQYPVEIHDELLYHCNGEWLTCQVVKIRNTSPPTWRIEYPPHYNCGPGVKPEVVEHAQLCQLRRQGLPKRMPIKVLDFIAEEGNFMVGGRAEVAWRRSQMLRGLHRITERGDRPQGKRSKVNFGDDQVVSFPLKLLPWNTKGSRTKSECEDNAATEGSVGRFLSPRCTTRMTVPNSRLPEQTATTAESVADRLHDRMTQPIPVDDDLARINSGRRWERGGRR